MRLAKTTISRIEVIAHDLGTSPAMVVDMAVKNLQHQVMNEDEGLTPVFMPKSMAAELPRGINRATETVRDWVERSVKGR